MTGCGQRRSKNYRKPPQEEGKERDVGGTHPGPHVFSESRYTERKLKVAITAQWGTDVHGRLTLVHQMQEKQS